MCMDQGSIAERNEQVKRMSDVFKKADGVIVWLGKHDEFTSDTLNTMRIIAAISESEWLLVSYTSFYNWLGFM